MYSFEKTKEEASKRLGELESIEGEARSEEKLGKHDYHYDAEEILQRITKAVTDTSEEILEQSNATTKANKDFKKTPGNTNTLANTKTCLKKSLKAIQNYSKNPKNDDVKDKKGEKIVRE